MVGTEFIDGQGLGNQLFCYVTARAVAKERGFAFGTAGQECFAVTFPEKIKKILKYTKKRKHVFI